MIVNAHAEVCPWKRRGCDSSIQRIEGLLNMPTALAGLEQRYQSMVDGAVEVPDVVQLPSTEVQAMDEQELQVVVSSAIKGTTITGSPMPAQLVTGVNPAVLNVPHLGW